MKLKDSVTPDPAFWEVISKLEDYPEIQDLMFSAINTHAVGNTRVICGPEKIARVERWIYAMNHTKKPYRNRMTGKMMHFYSPKFSLMLENLEDESILVLDFIKAYDSPVGYDTHELFGHNIPPVVLTYK